MRSARTDKVMTLIGKTDEEKPVNPMLKIPEGEPVPVIFTKSVSGTQLVNVIFLLINEQLAAIMERFNCCMCDKCAAAVTAEVLSRSAPVFVEVKRKSDADEVNMTAAQHRSEVISSITKAVIAIKSCPPHGNF